MTPNSFLQLAATLAFITCGILILTLIVGLVKTLRNGTNGIDQLDRAGFGAAAFWRGELPKQSAGSSVSTSDGVNLAGSNGKVRVKQTRTISRHFF